MDYVIQDGYIITAEGQVRIYGFLNADGSLSVEAKATIDVLSKMLVSDVSKHLFQGAIYQDYGLDIYNYQSDRGSYSLREFANWEIYFSNLVGENVPNPPGAVQNIIAMSPSDYKNDLFAVYFDGSVQQLSFERIIAHEVFHIINDSDDPKGLAGFDLNNTALDYEGENVRITNSFMADAYGDLPDGGVGRGNYQVVKKGGAFAWGGNGELFEEIESGGETFTKGQTVDRVLIDHLLQEKATTLSSASELVFMLGGNDTVIMSGGIDFIYGGQGLDTIDYSKTSNAITVTFIKGVQEGLLFKEFTVTGGFGDQDSFDSIERIIGSKGADTFLVNDVVSFIEFDRIDGFEGVDTVNLSGFDAGYYDNVELISIEHIIASAFPDNFDFSNYIDLSLENDELKIELGGGVDSFKGSLEAEIIYGHSESGADDDNELDNIDGGGGDDTIYGQGGNDILNGGAGKDKLLGGDGTDMLDGGANNDELNGSDVSGDDGVKDDLTGGEGVDIYHVGNNDVIHVTEGQDKKDTIYLNGTKLTGPKDNEEEEQGENCEDDPDQDADNDNKDGPWEGDDGATYERAGQGNLKVTLGEATITIVGFSNGDFGWEIPEEKENDDKQEDAGCDEDPFVIDLDGDGLEFQSIYEGAYFDYGADGFADRTAWVTGDDGILAIDLNGDGKIIGREEIFNGPDGILAALGSLDSNLDGVLDVSDAGFANLLIWKDENADGRTDAGELRQLSEFDITSIDLAGAVANHVHLGNGASIHEETTVTLGDGSTLDAATIGFVFNDHLTVYLGDTEVDAALSALPYLNGYGTTRDLDVAMSEDQALQTQVVGIATMTAADAHLYAQAIEDMMVRWHRAEDASVDGRGNYANGQHLAVMEALFGSNYDNQFVLNTTSNPRPVAGTRLEESFTDYQSNVAARMLAQTDLGAQIFPELGYYSAAFLEVAEGTSVTMVLGRMAGFAPADSWDALSFWKGMALVLNAVRDQFTEADGFETAVNDFMTAQGIGFTFDQILNAYIGDEGGSILLGRATLPNDEGGGWFGVNDFYISGEGDDTFIDLGGMNTIVYGEGRGNDTVEIPRYKEIVVQLVDLTADDITVSISDSIQSTLTITVNSTGETLTFTQIQSFDNPEAVGSHVTVVFGDGAVVNLNALVLGIELEIATDGNDTLTGTIIDDVLDGGLGDDSLDGGRGGDTYLVGPGNGSDTIQDSGLPDGSQDIVRIDANYADVTTDYNNGDFLITFATGEVLTVVDAANIESWEFQDQIFTGAEFTQILFDVARTITGTEIGERIDGTSGADIIIGGQGDDFLYGAQGGDTYIYRAGDGADSIIDYGDSETDTLIIEGYNLEDATLSIDPASTRVLIIDFGNGDLIRLSEYVNRETVYNNRIEDIVFDDGTVLTRDDVYTILLESQITDGDDNVNGFDYFNETIEAGLGNDTITGGNFEDVFIFNAGDGQDSITDRGGIEDTVLIQGYDLADMTVTQDPANASGFILTFANSTDQITISQAIEFVDLDDASLTRAEMQQTVLDGFNNNSDGLNVTGYVTDDTYQSGAGDDVMTDGYGNDTYIFATGDGNDVINDTGPAGGQIDTVIFTDINLTDVDSVVKSGGNVTLSFSSGDSLTLQGQLSAVNAIFYNYAPRHTIEEFQFADGSTMTWSEFSDYVFQSITTDGNDLINGTDTSQTLFLSNGDDELRGYDGNDVFVRDASVTGDDIINERGIATTDTLILNGVNASDITTSASGTNMVISFVTGSTGSVTLIDQFGIGSLSYSAIENIEFADGTVWDYADMVASIKTIDSITTELNGTSVSETVAGTSADELINGLGGDDVLQGGSGSDVYVYAEGSGNDVISEVGNSSRADADWIRLDSLSPNDVEFARQSDGNDLYIAIVATNEVLTVSNHFGGTQSGIEFIQFGDGTVWNRSDIQSNAPIRGTIIGEALISGSTNDTLLGLAGNDTLIGNNGSDLLIGGAGDDILQGGLGDDIYRFGLGDGNDVLSESSETGSYDVLELTGLALSDVRFVQETTSDDLVIELSDGSSLRLVDQLEHYTTVGSNIIFSSREIVEVVRFDDGTELSPLNLLNLARVYGSDGDDNLTGTINSESFDAGLGDDILTGGAGRDNYYWSIGDGNDVINDGSDYSAENRLVLTDVHRDGAILSRDGNNLLVTIVSSEEIITIIDHFIFDTSNWRYDSYFGIGEIQFSDALLTRSDISKIFPVGTAADDFIEGAFGDDLLEGLEGNDYIGGDRGNDEIIGGLGDDELEGGYGSDTYVWTVGDGNDSIFERSSDFGTDTLRLVGVTESDISFERGLANSHLFVVLVSGETIQLTNQLSGSRDSFGQLIETPTIERILLDNGTELPVPTFSNNFDIVGTDASELILGDDNDNVLQGGLGVDFLEGDEGADTYIWTIGDGNDVIRDRAFIREGETSLGFDADTLRLIGVTADDIQLSVSATRLEYNPETNVVEASLNVTIISTGEVITIQSQFESDGINDYSVEQILLDDGTTIDLPRSYDGLELLGTEFSDFLFSNEGGSTYRGLGGSDEIFASRNGSDTFIWSQGDGNDFIYDSGQASDFDRLVLEDVLSDQVSYSKNGEDLEVTINSTGETITITGQFAAPFASGSSVTLQGIESIQFADGSAMDRETIASNLGINENIVSGTDGNDTLLNSASNEVFLGGLGDDIYVFDRGAGEDIVVDAGGDTDVVDMGSGVLVDFIVPQRIGNDLLLEIGGTDRLTLTISGQFNPNSDTRVEEFRFEDGTILTASEIENMILSQQTSDGDDSILGFFGNDIIKAGSGDDIINGDGGLDIIDGGDGYDVLVLDGYASNYLVVTDGATTTVSHIYNDTEAVSLTNVEVIQFANNPNNSSDDSYEFLVDNLAPITTDLIYTMLEDDVLTVLVSDILSAVTDPDGGTVKFVSLSNASGGVVGVYDVVGGFFTFETVGEVSPYANGISEGSGSIVLSQTDTSVDITNAFALLGSPNVENPTTIPHVEIQGIGNDEEETFVLNLNDPGATIIFDMDGSSFDTLIQIRDANGNVLASNDDASTDEGAGGSTSGFESYLEYTTTGAGPFFLIVQSYGNPAVQAGDTYTANISVVSSNADSSGPTAFNFDSFGTGNGEVLFVADADFNGNASFNYMVTDNFGLTSEGSVFINVVGVNDVPIAVDDAGIDVEEDTLLILAVADLVVNDTDVDNDDLQISAVQGAIGGAVEIINGEIHFTPDENYSGTAEFTYTISDGNGGTASAIAVINVTPVNDAPEFNDPGTFDSNQDRDFFLLTEALVDQFVDPEGDSVSFVSAQNGINGLVSVDEDGILVFSPEAGYFGPASFEITVTDGSSTSTVIINLNILYVNEAPIVMNVDLGAFNEDGSITFTEAQLLAESTDPDGGTLSIVSVAVASDNGTITDNSDGTFTFTPIGNLNGDDIEISFFVSDGNAVSNGVALVDVTSVNDAPMIAPLVDHTFEEDQSVFIEIPSGTFLDVDDDEILVSATLTDGSSLPAWLIFDAAAGTFFGLPPADFYGTIAISVTASDGTEGVSDQFDITITPVNDGPEIGTRIGNESFSEDAFVSITLPEDAFIDVDSDMLIYSANLADGMPLPSWLTFDQVSGVISGQPPENFNGILDIIISASDGIEVASQQFELIITAVNDAPIVVTPLNDRNVMEDQPFAVTVDLQAFEDVDGDELNYIATLASGLALPIWLTFDDVTGILSGTPPQDFTGTIEISITASDGTLSVTDNFNINVLNINDAPIIDFGIQDVTVDEDAEILFSINEDAFNDVDGDSLIYIATMADGQPLVEWLTFDGEAGTFSGTPPLNYNGSIEIAIEATDGIESVQDNFTLTISAVNDAPFAQADFGYEVSAGGSLTMAASDLLLNDVDIDGDQLNVISVEGTGNGDVVLNDDGSIIYTPDSSLAGIDTFTYTISDGDLTSSATVVVEVTDDYISYDINGTEFNDKLFGDLFSENSINGAGGQDIVKGGFLDDRLAGGEDDDMLFGRSGNDELDGGSGNDRILAGSGDDNIIGGTGDDVLFGGSGADTFIFAQGDGSDQIFDFNRGSNSSQIGLGGDLISIDIDGIDNFDTLMGFASQQGNTTTFDFGNGDMLILKHTELAALDADAFTFV